MIINLLICGSHAAVAIGTDDSPVSVSKTGDARRNVIVWMDHRAEEQAERINASKSPVLQFAGGSLSPEHQAPKVNLCVATMLFEVKKGYDVNSTP